MKIIIFLNLFLFLGVTSSYINLVNNNILESKSKVSKNVHNQCFMDVVRVNFKANAPVTMFTTNHFEYTRIEMELVNDLFHSLNWTIYLYTQMNHLKLAPFGVRRNFVIILGNKSLKFMLNILHSFYVWDSKATYLIIVQNLQNQKNIVIANQENQTEFEKPTILVENVFYDSTSKLVTEHYISNPTTVNKANKPFEILTKIGSCQYGDSKIIPHISTSSILGPELRTGAMSAPPFLFIKSPENLLSGSEIKLTDTIAEKLKMTVKYSYYGDMDKFGDVYESDETNIYGSGMLNDVILNKLDIAIGNIIISQTVHQFLGVSTSYSIDQITWILPVPRSTFKLNVFPFIYDLKMSLFFCTMYFFYPFMAHMATNYFHKTSNHERSRYQTFRGTCITFFAMSTGSTADIIPKTSRMRFFLFVWLFYTYHLNMYFASTLLGYLTLDQDGPKLKTVDELAASGMALGVDKRTYKYMKDDLTSNGNFTDGESQGKLIYCNSTKLCLSRIVQTQNFAMTLSQNYFSYVKNMFRSKNGKLSLMSLPETILTVPIGLIFKKGFPLENKLNIIVLRINEAGLFKYWNVHSRYRKTIEPKLIEFENVKTDDLLDFVDLQFVFYGIIAELFICFLVFVGELVKHKCNIHYSVARRDENVSVAYEYYN